MAFGIPGSEAQANGTFLGRLQYDARVGFWKIVRRVQQNDGGWDDEPSEPFKCPTFLLDLGTFEVGYINFSSPPAFLVVPYGHAIPPRPEEKKVDEHGKSRSAFQPGFRCKVYNPKMFGDEDAYYFANSSKTVLEPMDALHTLCMGAPEAREGKVPVIRVTGTVTNRVEGARGTNTYYAPVFAIIDWRPRAECFGPRTVPAPGSAIVAPKPTNGNGNGAHAKAPQSGGEDDWGMPSGNSYAQSRRGPDPDIDDEIPF